MDQINRVVRQRQNAEQKRQKKEKAERAARAIEEYEKQLKMERKIEVINEKIKKEKSKGLFMDVIIEVQSKKLEEMQQKAHKDEVAKAALRQAVAEECQQKCHFADNLNKVEAALEKANNNNKKLKDDLDNVQRQKAKNDAQNAAEIRRLESDLELVQHVTSATHQHRSHSAIGHFSFTTSTRAISSSEEEEEQNERAVDELAPIGAKNEQFTLEQELSLAQELEKLEEMGQQQQPMDIIDLDNAALVASEDVKEKENGRQKNGDEKSGKQKLPSATDSDGIDAPAPAKSADDQQQLKEEEQEEDGWKLLAPPTKNDDEDPAKCKDSQKQQPKKEGQQEKGGFKITLPPCSESPLGQDAVPTTSDSARATTAQAIIVIDPPRTPPPQIGDRKPNKCCFGFINQKNNSPPYEGGGN
ncbi:hypothetical protein niasHS_008888 [Heterodera schachtii]|uniref:Uncharacterized protein n=1 Tax=Heterodera schachtii TaxID=97005 RepID=A0ABD2IXP6_HETSC